MSEKLKLTQTTELLRQIQKEAIQNKSGRVLTPGVEETILSGLPSILQAEINRGNNVIVDYTGLVTVHKQEKSASE